MISSLLIASGLLLTGQPLNTTWFVWINAGPMTAHALAVHLTLLGSGYVVILLMLALDRGHGVGPALALRTVLIGAVLTRVGKAALAEPRPLQVLGADVVQVVGLPLAGSNAMPSGHTLTAFAGALALWWIWRSTSNNSRGGAPALLMLVMGLATGVAWSRMAVGAHWPADVLAGAGCGLLTATLAALWERHGQWARVLRQRLAQCMVALLEIAIAAVWLSLDLHEPGTQTLQLFVGAIGLTSGAWRLWRHMQPASAARPAQDRIAAL
ncbi:MAG: phosphatase PAP2 family protein [Pseudomonadota bacterium]|nr:phosphatase PAP2 family protein [Pseudomonadota bacterium]